jgi:uncharacterized surface protein with fasciclin (FAS1) repeats
MPQHFNLDTRYFVRGINLKNTVVEAFFVLQESLTAQESRESLIEVLKYEGIFTRFLDLLQRSGVGDEVRNKGPFRQYTVFAPVDDAFDHLTTGTIESLGGGEQMAILARRHIVPGKHTMVELEELNTLPTLSGYPLMVIRLNGLEIDDAKIVKPDIPYNYGLIQAIDRVLFI